MSIYNMLFPWQKKIIDSHKDELNYGLFLDMGLGKTPISLAFAETNQCTKMLIVTLKSKAIEPESCDGSWRSWAAKSDIRYKIQSGSKAKFDNHENDCFLTNYESLFVRQKTEEKAFTGRKSKKISIRENINEFIDSCKGHTVALILDESHKLKAPNSCQTLAINKIKQTLLSIGCKVHTYLLTGTPFTKGYEDLYSQLVLLGVNMTKTKFKDQFCKLGNIYGLLGWQQPIVGYKNVDKLFDLVHEHALTIKSNEVADLPDQVFVSHEYPESFAFKLLTREKLKSSDVQRALIEYSTGITIGDELKKSKINNPFYRNINYPSDKWLAETVACLWLRAREISIGFQGNSEGAKWFDRTRLNNLKDFLENHPDNYILFYNFEPELFEIYDICDSLGYNIDVYCGQIKSEIFYEKFAHQTEEEQLTNTKNIMIANFESGSTGKNWQKYNKCILFSVPLYDSYEQGLKRVHRTGQTRTVIYHTFYQNNFLDASMVESLRTKSQYSADLFETDLKNFKNFQEK